MDDIDDITEYCSEPVFEEFMVTPWPYGRKDAEGFVAAYAPAGWSTGSEWTWAIRGSDDPRMLGAISIRLRTGMVGFWLGAPHRGKGIMPEALAVVIDEVFKRTELQEIRWECVVGNLASSRVARKVGFRFTGEALGIIPGRSGLPAPAWTGRIARDDVHAPRPGWPDWTAR